MGLREGKTVEMLNNPGHGPLVVRVDESRLALGRGVAMKVSVRRTGE
jgi:ferrous iron transport protein A